MRRNSLRSLAFSVITGLCALAAGVASAQTCKEEVGPDDAQTFVDQCIEVSPATRPPCNAENSCQLIWDEISRGCAMLGNDAPEFCSDY